MDSIPEAVLRLMRDERTVQRDVCQAALAERDILPCLQVTGAALALLYDLFFTASTSDEQQHRRVHMVLRTYNSIAAALSLARNGYLLHSFMAQRDLMEHALLVDYFGGRPDEFAVWCTCPAKKRKERFRPGHIRKALNERDGIRRGTQTWRDKIYRLLSQYAVHPDPQHWRFATTRGHLLLSFA